MSRPAPVPFVPDQFDQVVIEQAAAPAPVMLSQIIAGMERADSRGADRAEGPGTSRPLSNREKWRLSDLAEVVFETLKKAGRLPGQTLEAWRRAESIKACTRRISEATAGDKKKIQAWFLKLKGNERAAAKAAVKATQTAYEIAVHALRVALGQGSKGDAYAEGIARRVYKRSVSELSSKEVWSVVYTVRNANNAAAGKGDPSRRYKSLKAKRANSKQNKSL